MTAEEQTEWLDACAAMLAGEPIEFRSSKTGAWISATNIEAGRPHRRKPAPELPPAPAFIPLGPDDVLGCVLRMPTQITGCISIEQVEHDKVRIPASGLRDRVFGFAALQSGGWLFHRPGDIGADGLPIWKRCEK